MLNNIEGLGAELSKRPGGAGAPERSWLHLERVQDSFEVEARVVVD